MSAAATVQRQAWWQWLPVLPFAFAAALAAALLAQYIHVMATTSIWNDEFYTLVAFSTKGPFVAWTDYHVPNNHILYNIANSFWPERIAYEPVPARLLSFLATIAAFVLLAWFAVRERSWGGGALALLLLADTQTLDLALQARGYGFAMLAAMVQAVATARYLADGSRGWLVVAAAGALAAVATLPVCVLLAAPLALGLLLLRPRREVVVVLGATALLGIAFYLPTAVEVVEVSRNYAREWGTEYATVGAVMKTLRYVLPNDPLGLVCLAAILVSIAVALVRGEPHRRDFLVLSLAALAVFFAICLAMTTPLVRTTQFAAAMVPVLLVAASGTAGMGSRRLWIMANVVLFAVAVPVAIAGAERLRDLRFVPIEAWRESADIADAVSAAPVPVYVTFRSSQFAVYLDDPDRIVDSFDADLFRRGGMVVVDASFRETERFTGADHAPGAIDVIVPQRRGGRQVVSFVPQDVGFDAHVAGATPADLAPLDDGDPQSAWKARNRKPLSITPTGACDRLIILGAQRDFAETVDIRVGPRGSRIPGADRVFAFDRLAVVDLTGLAPGPILIAPRDGGPRLSVAEVWCTPPAPQGPP